MNTQYINNTKIMSTIHRQKLKEEIIEAIYGRGGWTNNTIIRDYKISIIKNNLGKTYSLHMKYQTDPTKIKIFNSLDECIDYIFFNFS